MRGFVIGLLVLGIACKSNKEDPGPSCAAVVAHLNEIMKINVPNHGNMELNNQAAMLQQCEARKMSAAERTCLLGTKTTSDMAVCSAARTLPPLKPTGVAIPAVTTPAAAPPAATPPAAPPPAATTP